MSIDELTLCVPMSGRGGGVTLDEMILFLDPDSERGKTAAVKNRKLVDAHITASVGVQWDVLPNLLSGPGGIDENI